MFDKVNLSAGVFHFKWGADSDWRLGKEDSVSAARTQLHHAVSGRPDADSFHRELIRYFSIFISQVNAWDSSAASHVFCSKRSLLWITSLCSSLKVISRGSGGGNSSHSAFFLYSSLSSCTFACLCRFFLCAEIVPVFTQIMYKTNFCVCITARVNSDLCFN